ncbi:MAG: hypothetical protein OSA93_02190 [Akkermansiaceae bacterium]|nr:hypothetical protein [Akkermansiaceae bacterium]
MESNLFELRITPHSIVTLTASVLPGSANHFSEHEAAGLIALAIRPFRLRLPQSIKNWEEASGSFSLQAKSQADLRTSTLNPSSSIPSTPLGQTAHLPTNRCGTSGNSERTDLLTGSIP